MQRRQKEFLPSPIATPVINKLIRRTSAHLLGSSSVHLLILGQYCGAMGWCKYFKGKPSANLINGCGVLQLSPVEDPSQFSKL